MNSSQPEPIELTLRDRSRLIARDFGDFVLFQRPASPRHDMAKVGQWLFDQKLSFVDDVIATEVEVCLAVNRKFTMDRLFELQEIEFGETFDALRRHHELPILIDEAHDDWDAIQSHTGLSQTQYLERLLGSSLSVAMTGFIPGFVYLGGLPKELQVPRKRNPATHTQRGTFAIGGRYAGVYSLPSAAGWNCIGRIAPPLFDEASLPPVSVSAGDSITLRRVDAAEFERLNSRPKLTPTKNDNLTNANHGRLRFEHVGLLSMIQDRGRTGHAWFAIPRCGPMDATSAEMANVILGNDIESPVLEFHFLAPKIRFLSDATVCLTGADMGWEVDGKLVGRAQTVSIPSGSLLTGTVARDGCRSYMAIHGEIQTRRSFGSAATYTPAGFGGNAGKAFSTGDELCWSRALSPLFPLQVDLKTAVADAELPCVAGPEFKMMDAVSQDAIFREEFCITPKSDRMGARLDGPTLSITDHAMLDSVPLLPGMIQLTPQGQLIVVLQDGQTTGGYPRVGYLDCRSVEQLNQTKLGQPFRFCQVEADQKAHP